MPNIFVTLPLPPGNGAGPGVSTSSMGGVKTIVVVGAFAGATLTIEASCDGGVVFAPVITFQSGAGRRVVEVACDVMRVRVSGALAGVAASVEVASNDIGGQFAAIPIPAGNGPGPAIDISTMGLYSTVIAGGAFPGAALLIQVSDDGVDWASFAQFTGQGDLRSGVVTANWVRAFISGRKAGVAFTATCAIGTINDATAGISGIDVDDEGVPLAGGPFTALNFIGAGVLATDAGGGVADVTIPGTGLAVIAPADVDRSPAQVGVSGSAARADHKHDIVTAIAAALLAGGASAEGVAVSLARSDHEHQAQVAVPAEIADSASVEGVASTFVRGDHVHAHGNRAGGALHALFTSAAAGFIAAPAISSPARALNATFQPSATRPVLVIYSVRIVCTSSLAGLQAGRVELRSDAAAPPVTVRGRVAGGAQGVLVIGLTIVDTVEAELVYLVPEGHNVRLETVNEANVPTFTLTAVTEIQL